jgi:hypothetical protein
MVHVDNFSINRPVALPAASIFLEQTGIPIASTPIALRIGGIPQHRAFMR